LVWFVGLSCILQQMNKYQIDLLVEGGNFMPIKNVVVSKVGVRAHELASDKPLVKLVVDVRPFGINDSEYCLLTRW